jgi:hypothetical protein
MNVLRIVMFIILTSKHFFCKEIDGPFKLCEKIPCIQIKSIIIPEEFDKCTKDFLVGFNEDGVTRMVFLINQNELVPYSEEIECSSTETRFEFEYFYATRLNNKIVEIKNKNKPEASPLMKNEASSKIEQSLLKNLVSTTHTKIETSTKTNDPLPFSKQSVDKILSKTFEIVGNKLNQIKSLTSISNEEVDGSIIEKKLDFSLLNDINNIKLFGVIISSVVFSILIVIILLVSKDKLNDLWLFLKAIEFFDKKNVGSKKIVKKKNIRNDLYSIEEVYDDLDATYDQSSKMFTPKAKENSTKDSKLTIDQHSKSEATKGQVLAVTSRNMSYEAKNNFKNDIFVKKIDIANIIEETNRIKEEERKILEEEAKINIEKKLEAQKEADDERLNKEKKNKELLAENIKKVLREEEEIKQNKIQIELIQKELMRKEKEKREIEASEQKNKMLDEEKDKLQKLKEMILEELVEKKKVLTHQIICSCVTGSCTNCLCAKAKEKCNVHCHNSQLQKNCKNC